MEWKDLLGELVELVRTAAPSLWELAKHSVYADVVTLISWSVVLDIVAFALYKLGRHLFKRWEAADRYDKDEYSMGTTMAWAVSAVTALLSAGLLFDAIHRLIAIDYHTLGALIEFVK